jgi:GNAT superfamily N-acetyltransferase
MKDITITLRVMDLNDIEGAIRLSKAEGWNQTEKDWKLLIENTDNVCLLAEVDGKIVGTTTAINYSNEEMWIGMVLVDKDYRGQGISKSLLTDIFQKTNFCKSIKLDATPVGQPVYQKFGFKEEYLIARMVNQSMDPFPFKDDLIPEPIELRHIQEIAELDEIIFGVNRHQLIEFLIKQYPGKGWLLKRNKRITGFVLGRDGNKYHQIGPLVAETAIDAKILVSKALKHLYQQSVVVDVLYDKEHLIDWLNSIGFVKQRHFIRMYKEKNIFPGVIDNLYLICGPEFG